MKFKTAAEAVVASYTGRDDAFGSRLAWWITFFEDKDLVDISSSDIEDGIDLLVSKPRMTSRTTKGGVVPTALAKPISASTVNRYVSSLGTMFKELRRRRLLPRGYVSPMRGVGRLEEGEGRTLSVTVKDVFRLVAMCRVSRNRQLAALVAMACTTGWRAGSLQRLRWMDVDIKNRTADTLRTKNGTPHRTVLLGWVTHELEMIRPAQAKPQDLVFGKHNVSKAFRNALKAADLPTEWTFHHCRHIAASILAQSGASVPIIMQALGHKTPMMAMRYSHLNLESLRDNVSRAWV